MTPVLHITNPLEPFDVDTITTDGAGGTIQEWAEATHQAEDFDLPTICILNGEPVLRADWGYKLKEKDVLSFVALAGDPVTIIIAVVVAIIAVAVTLLLAPKVPGELGDSDPVYSLKGQSNRVRLGEPIETRYGKTVAWPSYAARPYNQYIGNEQFQYSLFCLGQGEYTIHEIYIEDTPLSFFDEVEYEVIGPGGAVGLFPDNVVTSVEVSNIDLLGDNEDTYPEPDGWFGPFVANGAGTLTNLLQVDIVFPNGLYKLDEGKRKSTSATYQVSYREIDDDGIALGSFVDETAVTVSRRTGTPQRFTIEVPVTSGRYEVRVRRVGSRSKSAEISNVMQWEALRAFLPSTKDYGDVTLLATKIRATNQINNNSRSRIRVDSTRKLPIWDGMSWSAPAATRNPVWAFIDILKAEYGGRLVDSYIRLDDLLTLATTFDTREDYFDWTFDRRSTVWEAAKTCLRVGRSTPMLFGSQVSAVRDGPKTVAQGVFNKENVVPGSFKWDLRLVDNEDFDHVVVEYVDEDDGLPLEVVCRLPTDGEDYPEVVKMSGITSRDQAYREGMFYRATRKYHRETITFRTGMEGYIPAFGDLIKLAYDVPRWGFGGYVVGFDAVGKQKITLSDPVGLSFGTRPTDPINYIMFRKADGSALGPYILDNTFYEEEAGAEPSYTSGFSNGFGTEFQDLRIVQTLDVLPTEAIDELQLTDPDQEPTYFLVGIGENIGKDLKVQDLRPTGEGEVEVTAVNYTDRVYAYDTDAAPALAAVTLPPKIPTAPIVTVVNVTSVADRDDVVVVSWQPAFGAQFYILEESDTGAAGSWSQVIQTRGTSYVLEVTPGDLFLRVAAVNETVGPFALWDGEVGIPANPPAAPTLSPSTQSVWEGLTISAAWEPYLVAGKQSFVMRVYETGNVVTGVTHFGIKATTFGLTLDYDADEMDADLGPSNTVRDVTLGIVAINAAGESEETTVQLVNPAPDAITADLLATYNSDTGTGAVYDITWTYSPPPDLMRYEVHGSYVNAFTPDGTTLLGSTSSLGFSNGFSSGFGKDGIQIEVPFGSGFSSGFSSGFGTPGGGSHSAFYWRVVALDRFGDDVTVGANVNFSSQQTIPAK